MHGKLLNFKNAFIGVLLTAASFSFGQRISPADGDQTAMVIRQLLTMKCAECHSPRSTNRKAKRSIGDIADLRLLVDSKQIVPGMPEQSPLWQRVSLPTGDDEVMPPSDARNGGISEEQRTLIRLWIATGAPAPTSTRSATSQQPATSSSRANLLSILGRFHVVIVHFPIALLLVGTALYGGSIAARRPGWANAAVTCYVLGSFAAVVAALLGWLDARGMTFAPEDAKTLTLHRWLGTATALLACAALSMTFLKKNQSAFETRIRDLLFIAASLLVGLVGHLGGSLVYGANFFFR